MNKEKIINIAVIAHVDAGKSTLVDAFLNQSGIFRANEHVPELVMDSNDLERERGITIYSKNCSIRYKDYKINIVDTPGHADFSGEVERIIKTVDTVLLLVDSSEGPMPQTRFVLQKSLEMGLRPILLINKIDKKDQRAEEVVDLVYELFLDLKATDKQLDFPILYGVAREGVVVKNVLDEGKNLQPLFETIVDHIEAYPDLDDKPLQMQVSSLGYDDYIGRLGIGRIFEGTIKVNQQVMIYKRSGNIEKKTISQIYIYDGLKRTPVKEAYSGDIVIIAGIDDISIGETICAVDNVRPLEMIHIDEPTLTMNFLVNTSPFAGQSGKYVTSRNIKERLYKEMEVNVGLKVEETETTDKFKVSGRGELHLTILIENMRREGYELAVSKPEVIFHYEDGKKMEPIEKIIINMPTEYIGVVMTKLNARKGVLTVMNEENNYVYMEWLVPTRGLIGYRTELINDTHGDGILVRSFYEYQEFRGDINSRTTGVMISNSTGVAMTYSIFNLQDHGVFFITPQTKVYEGMIVGQCSKEMDMEVNPTKNKKGTAVRSAGTDEAMRLTPPRILTLENAVEYIREDELVEITPDAIRMRKKYLTAIDRKNSYRNVAKDQDEK